MKSKGTSDPNETYRKLPDNSKPVQLFISPSQYIQGRGVINLLGEYLSLCVSGGAGVLITPGRDLALGGIVDKSLNSAGFTVKKLIFQGESSLSEVKRVATFYEARCCMENPEARTARGARPTMAALAIARQCRDLLLHYGTAALAEIRNQRVGEALANIAEANILLSGLGFESGGLAGAHGVAQGLTACSDLHTNCLHGELVAIGIVTQLIMEKRMDEAVQAAQFFKDVGLPLHLAQLGFDPLQRGAELDNIVRHSLKVFFIRYEPFEITHNFLKAAILEANKFGMAMEIKN